MKIESVSDLIPEALARIKRLQEGKAKIYEATIKFGWCECNTCSECPCFSWDEKYNEGTCGAFFDKRKKQYTRVLSDFMPSDYKYLPVWCPMTLVEVESLQDLEGDDSEAESYLDNTEIP